MAVIAHMTLPIIGRWTMPASLPSSYMGSASVVNTSKWEASFLQPIFSCFKKKKVKELKTLAMSLVQHKDLKSS